MSRTISPKMAEAIRIAGEHGGELHRVIGGFWTWPGCPSVQMSFGSMPEWSVSHATLDALIATGNAEPCKRSARGHVEGIRIIR